jgi:hypothetical protein
MDCLKFNIFDLNVNENYLIPILGLFGLAITYLGNKFIKPTLFVGGTLISSTSSYKLTEFILIETKHNNCDILYIATLLTSISGGFIILKLYKFMNFILGFFAGGSMGYLLYISWLHKYCLGVYFIFDNMFWICSLTPGLLCGIITYIKEKELSMLLTALIGPALIVVSSEKLLNETIKDYPLLNYSIYILIYLFFSITGFYVQNKRKKNNENDDKQINYKPHYKCINS